MAATSSSAAVAATSRADGSSQSNSSRLLPRSKSQVKQANVVEADLEMRSSSFGLDDEDEMGQEAQREEELEMRFNQPPTASEAAKTTRGATKRKAAMLHSSSSDPVSSTAIDPSADKLARSGAAGSSKAASAVAVAAREEWIWSDLPMWLLEVTREIQPTLIEGARAGASGEPPIGSTAPTMKTHASSPAAVLAQDLVARLVQLAEAYLHKSAFLPTAAGTGSTGPIDSSHVPTDTTSDVRHGKQRDSDQQPLASFAAEQARSLHQSSAPSDIAPDYTSSALYASLALCFDSASFAARRALAFCALHGGEAFPFFPSSSSPASPSSHATGTGGGVTAAAAHAALRILQQGSERTWSDLGSAQVYAAACRRLGRIREAEQALGWTFAREDDPSTSSTAASGSDKQPPSPPALLAHTDPLRAQVLTQLGALALSTNRPEEARDAYHAALEMDRWCWSAWVGVCDSGGANVPSSTSESRPQPREGHWTREHLFQRVMDGDKGASAAKPMTSARVFDEVNMARHKALDWIHPSVLVRLEEMWSRLQQQPPVAMAVSDIGGAEMAMPSSQSQPQLPPSQQSLAPVSSHASGKMAGVSSSGEVAKPSREPLNVSQRNVLPTAAAPRTAIAGGAKARTRAPADTADAASTTSRSTATTARAPSRAATAPARTLATTIGAGYQRPGSRVDSGTNASLANKRTRSTAGAATAPVTTATGRAASQPTRPAPGTKQAVPATGTRGANGALASSRTNLHPEQMRASSQGATRSTRTASVQGDDASMKADDKESDAGSVRRSARMTAASTKPLGVRGTRATGTTARPTATAAKVPTRAPTGVAARRGAVPLSTSRSLTGGTAAARPPQSNLAAPVQASTSSSSDVDAEMEAAEAQARSEAVEKLKEEASAALQTAVTESRRWSRVDAAIVDLLRVLGEAYRCVRSFKGKRSLWLLRSVPNDVDIQATPLTIDDVIEPGEKQADLARFVPLPPAVRSSASVQVLLGRVYHDMSLYADAERHFEAARAKDPTLLSGMDIYSLVLFHLNREVGLSALAQLLMLLDEHSPTAQVVIGNAFSLQREHSLALKAFRRAVLLAPSYAYAYTLAGYEAHELGSRDEARAFFRSALRCERRHWNAWSGLGQICLLDGNHAYAEFHYMQAVSINSQNAVLWDILAWVLELSNERAGALRLYDKALSLNSAMPMTILKRGELLSHLGRVEDAHDCFLRACALTPDEARVHILLAKSYMRLSGGFFAELEPNDDTAEAALGGDSSVVYDAAGFVRKHTAGGAGGAGLSSGKAKATGAPRYGEGYEMAIAHHLAIAVDLDPRAVRTIRAMGEGVHAALQSAAKKGGVFDPSGMAEVSVSLQDASAEARLEAAAVARESGAVGGNVLHVHHDATQDASRASRYTEPDEPSETSGDQDVDLNASVDADRDGRMWRTVSSGENDVSASTSTGQVRQQQENRVVAGGDETQDVDMSEDL